MSDLPPITRRQYSYTFYPIPDWFYWGPRVISKYDLRSGDVSTPDNSWTDWEEATHNNVFEGTLHRYVQHRFYVWIPQDVRVSRQEAVQFIYKHFVLKWWGSRFRYQYTLHSTYYIVGSEMYQGYTYAGEGLYQFANWNATTPTTGDELPVFEVV